MRGPARGRLRPDVLPAAPGDGRGGRQGLTLVHVRAQLEHIRDTFMGQVGLSGAQRQLKLS